MIPLFRSNFGPEELAAASAVIESGWLSMGEQVAAFEQEFSGMLGGNAQSFATTNCTASLFLALLALDLQPGDEVLVPALSFVADANVVTLAGGRPVFVDISGADDLNVSPADIESKITDKTKAILIVHFSGFSCDMEAIQGIAEKNRLSLIEDCAHAPGASYQQTTLGLFGDISCFSFYSNKNMSTGEGGMVVSKNEEYALKLKQLRSHGMTTATLDRHKGRASSYDVTGASLNLRMDEIRASIGRVQLSRLEAANAERRQLFSAYGKHFKNTQITMPFSEREVEDAACHILVVVLPEDGDRAQIMGELKNQDIQTSIHYPPFWSFTAYSDVDPADTPKFRSIADRVLTLPLSPGITADEVSRVCDTLLTATNS